MKGIMLINTNKNNPNPNYKEEYRIAINDA